MVSLSRKNGIESGDLPPYQYLNGFGEQNMEKPITYRIRVRGVLSQEWSERLADMAITVDRSSEKGPVTTLEGRLRDQAALSAY